MSNPTSEQLADPTWWAANDPSKGEATHYAQGSIVPWERREGRTWYCWHKSSDTWVFFSNAGDNRTPAKHLFTRPKAITWPDPDLPPINLHNAPRSTKQRDATIVQALNVVRPPEDDAIQPRQYLLNALGKLYDAGLLQIPDEK